MVKIPTHVSNNGLELIKSFEGFEPNLYNDAVGHATIGYGFLVHYGNVDGSESEEFKKGITEERALELLKEELVVIEKAIQSLVKVDLSQNEFDSLAAFIYNCGRRAFANSTLLRKLNLGDRLGAGMEFLRWDKAGGKRLKGLTNRRRKEMKLFLTPSV